MNKLPYEQPMLTTLEVRVEHGFAQSTTYDNWNDTGKGTEDAYLEYGESDDEWA